MTYPIDDYDRALPETAQSTAPEPDEDDGHLLPQEVWDEVVKTVETGDR